MFRTELVCHRGANQVAPENTYAASEAAIALGAAYVEIDVRMSRDGVAYVLHDATVDRTTNGSGAIADMTSAELDTLDAGSWFSPEFAGQRLPKFDEWLGWLKGKGNAYVEVKQAPVPLVREMMRKQGWHRDSCYFLSGDNDIRAELVREMPEYRHMEPVRRNKNGVDGVAANGFSIIELLVSEMTPENMAAARAKNLEIQVFHPADDPGAFRRIIEADADLANVNHPETFRLVRAEMSATT
ncbi:MAG: glycerophosphodiester phosphodiesterase family protein [Hyphomicrobiales bacterium]|nr:glycerophosphodiester phosphodiesterase family protein [Hyphomicrobiales bacterium]